VNDITTFLLQRIAEDEAVIPESLRKDRIDNFITWDMDRLTADVGATRWLADCEAKRRIVDDLGNYRQPHDPDWTTAQVVLKLLALPYADHPDYREEWRLA
jgi:hypothetical protein